MSHEEDDHELELYADNTGELYPAKKAVVAMLKKKIAAGTYHHEAAARAWAGWFQTAAKHYAREIDRNVRFSSAEIKKLAHHRARYELERIERGEWD